MNTYTDADVFHFNQFKVWRLKGVADDRGVITKVQARLLCEDIPVLDAVAELGEPDPVLVQKFLNRNPESGQYLFRHSEDDATGFLASDRVERKHLAEWTWAVLDKDALEAQGLANWWEIIAARRAEKGKAPDPVKTLTEIQANIANGLRPKVQEDLGGMPGEFGVDVDTGDGIPESFRGLMVDGEAPEKFTERMRRRWQYLQHLRIDGTKPTDARALPDMTEEESIELADLEDRNKASGGQRWLD